MSEYGFVQNLSPVDYAHLLQGENLENGQLNGTITEIGPNLVATTTIIQGVVTDGETKVTKLIRKEGNQYFKNIYEAFLAKKDVGNDEKSPFLKGENKKGTNPFEEENATHTLILVTTNKSLGKSESLKSRCRRFGIYSLMILVILLLFSGGIAICQKWEFSFSWFSFCFIGISVFLFPIVLWILSRYFDL